ncbi:nicotinate-nucleotide adenylyltransferase [Sphingomonas sp.]|uniref:nicotinate-nucleotide adenylyltransferase n=1 Tax=Sphingomonas sp. TaxID=28214 RepID=UPI00182210FB|nr:nicotinate-nucleotide adenylyltransferase [Sphingomonas sp.]MBA3512346.1 nicotinate-nucleotide adenylyltransferase [Sphingomonas sp.]
MKRIGLLGGSFNPAHRGHRRISLAAIDKLGLDEVWWLVSPGNPLKSGEEMAPFEARLESARAMARRAPIRVSDFEARAGTRFSIDTVEELLRRRPRDRFIWLMGADTLAQFHRWKAWRRLAKCLPIAVISRPGYEGPARAARAMGWLRGFVRPSSQARNWAEWSSPAILLLRLPPDPTSATAIRALDPSWHRRSQSRVRPQRTGAPSSVRRALA